jgi:hypothetical protein
VCDRPSTRVHDLRRAIAVIVGRRDGAGVTRGVARRVDPPTVSRDSEKVATLNARTALPLSSMTSSNLTRSASGVRALWRRSLDATSGHPCAAASCRAISTLLDLCVVESFRKRQGCCVKTGSVGRNLPCGAGPSRFVSVRTDC